MTLVYASAIVKSDFKLESRPFDVCRDFDAVVRQQLSLLLLSLFATYGKKAFGDAFLVTAV